MSSFGEIMSSFGEMVPLLPPRMTTGVRYPRGRCVALDCKTAANSELFSFSRFGIVGRYVRYTGRFAALEVWLRRDS
jgi:hypothetical protein